MTTLTEEEEIAIENLERAMELETIRHEDKMEELHKDKDHEDYISNINNELVLYIERMEKMTAQHDKLRYEDYKE